MSTTDDKEIKHHLEALAKNFRNNIPEDNRNSKYHIRQLKNLQVNNWRDMVETIILELDQEERNKKIEEELFSDDSIDEDELNENKNSYFDFSISNYKFFIIPVCLAIFFNFFY
jgi:hypothetical protein